MRGWPARFDLCRSRPPRRRQACCCNNRRGQSGLWSLWHLRRHADRSAAHQRLGENRDRAATRPGALLLAHERLAGELVILNEDVSVYRQPLQDQIRRLIASGIEAQMLDKPGGIFVRRLEQIPE